MKVNHLRARARVSLERMANQLGVGAGEVLTLESMPLDGWEIVTLREYLAVLRCSLHVTVQDTRTGEVIELE